MEAQAPVSLINLSAPTNLLSYSKNLITDQTFEKLFVQLNTAGCAFDVTNGLGQASATSTWVLANFAVKNCVGRVKLQYPSPTTQGTEDLSAVARATNLKTGSENYYIFRLRNQLASIGKVVAGAAIVTIASGSFLVPQGVVFTVDFSIIGNILSATWTAPAITTRQLTTTDNDIPGAGLFGFRSLAKAVWCPDMEFTQQP